MSSTELNITKTCLYNFDPLKPHFYIVKLGFTGVYIIFLIFAQNIDCGYSLELPHQGGSNEYPQSMFWAGIWKISEIFIRKVSCFGGKIFSMYLNRCVFVMNNQWFNWYCSVSYLVWMITGFFLSFCFQESIVLCCHFLSLYPYLVSWEVCMYHDQWLTLVLLNKLGCHTHF